MKLKAFVKDRKTGEHLLLENDYVTKKAFAEDIKSNGYIIVNQIQTPEDEKVWKTDFWPEQNVYTKKGALRVINKIKKNPRYSFQLEEYENEFKKLWATA